MDIKIGDHIRAFLKKSYGVPDELVGREASPFNRRVEEVTKILPPGKYPSEPGRIKTKYSNYRLDHWDIKVVDKGMNPPGIIVDEAPIKSFAKTTDGREKC